MRISGFRPTGSGQFERLLRTRCQQRNAFSFRAQLVTKDRSKVSREISTSHTGWAKQHGIGLDFNPTYFSHPLAADGQTLSHADDSIWAMRLNMVPCSVLIRAMAQELVRGNYLDRVHIGLDFFDATINRVAAWVIGTRSVSKSLLLALLEPIEQLRQLETEGDFTARLALTQELATLPFGAVWDQFCARHESPTDRTWIEEIKRYERDVLSLR